MNKTILKGNLARDPEIKEVPTGGRTTKVANFTVATTRHFKKADGTRASDTTFIPCEAWDTGAESIEKLLKKGDPVLLEGSLKVENWEKDGKKHSRMKVRVITFDKLYRSPNSGNNTNEEQATKPTAEETNPTPQEPVATASGSDEDTPF